MIVEHLSEHPELVAVIQAHQSQFFKNFLEAFKNKKSPKECILLAQLGYEALLYLARHPDPILPGDLSEALTDNKNRHKIIFSLLNSVEDVLHGIGLTVQAIKGPIDKRTRYQLKEYTIAPETNEFIDPSIFPLPFGQIHFYRRFAGTQSGTANAVVPTLIIPPSHPDYTKLCSLLNLRKDHQLIVDAQGDVRFAGNNTTVDNNPQVVTLIAVGGQNIDPLKERLANFTTPKDSNYEGSITSTLSEYKPKILVNLIVAGIQTGLLEPASVELVTKYLSPEQLHQLLELMPNDILDQLKKESPTVLRALFNMTICG